MNNATIYRPASRTHPGRELLRLLIRRPATFGPPSFEKASFKFSSPDKVVDIKLN